MLIQYSMSSLRKFEDHFKKLNVFRRDKEVAPHKPCLLLAVIDQIETADCAENCFRYEERLLANYDRYFELYGWQATESKAYYPFVHLISDKFWFLHDHGNEVLDYTSKDAKWLTSQGIRKIMETVSFASLDNELFELLKDQMVRTRLREVLIQKWFQDKEVEYRNAVRETRILHEKYKIEEMFGEIEKIPDNYWRAVHSYRDPKFRYGVLKAYDFRCAATGWQLKVPPTKQTSAQIWITTLLEAAHIVPVSESRNNRINNGIALTPTLHLAMDRHLIAPGPDYRWHVSEFVQEQAQIDDGARQIFGIHNQRIILPENPRLQPTHSALEWSFEHLLKN